MALVGRRDGRNFGYGRQLSYAGPQALRDMFGGGHYRVPGGRGGHCLCTVFDIDPGLDPVRYLEQ